MCIDRRWHLQSRSDAAVAQGQVFYSIYQLPAYRKRAIAYPKVDLILLGGKVFPSSQVTLGISVFQMIQSIYPDWVIVGVSDLHPQKGLTTSDREEAIIKRCMVKQGGKRIVLATSEKQNTARNYPVASLAEIDYIVTENGRVDYIRQHWPSCTYQVL